VISKRLKQTINHYYYFSSNPLLKFRYTSQIHPSQRVIFLSNILILGFNFQPAFLTLT